MTFNPFATLTILLNHNLTEEALFYKEYRNIKNMETEFNSHEIPPFNLNPTEESNENESKGSNKLITSKLYQNFREVEKQKYKRQIRSYILSPKIISKFEEIICIKQTDTVKFNEISWNALSSYKTCGNSIYLSNDFLNFFTFDDKNNQKIFRATDYLDCLKLLSKIFFSFLMFEEVDQSIFYDLDSLVSEESLTDFIEVIMRYINGLESLGNHEQYYILYATTLMMSFLTHYEKEKIPIRKLLFSKIFIKFINFDDDENRSLVSSVTSNDSLISKRINPFNPRQSLAIYKLFVQLDVAKLGFLRMCDLKTINQYEFTDAFLDRLFHNVLVDAIDNEDKFDYILFLRFYLAIKYINSPRGVDLLFSVADIDGDGVISNFDILYFYKAMIKELKIEKENHSYDAFYSELLDYVKSSAKDGITKEQIYTTKSGETFFMLLFDKNTFREWEIGTEE